MLTIKNDLIIERKDVVIAQNEKVALWLDISGALFRDLLPKGYGLEICGQGMSVDDFAELVDRESWCVDHALESMADAGDETGVREIVSKLAHNTIIALFSRWAHYTRKWKACLHDPDPEMWVPPYGKDLWRAIFLAMTTDHLHSSEIVRRRWGEGSAGPQMMV